MNDRERKILFVLRAKGKQLSVGGIAHRSGIERTDVREALESLDINGYITVDKNLANGLIRGATINESGKQAYVDKVKSGSNAAVMSQLNELRAAIDKLQEAVTDIENKTPEERKSIAERALSWITVIQKAPDAIQSIESLLRHFT